MKIIIFTILFTLIGCQDRNHTLTEVQQVKIQQDIITLSTRWNEFPNEFKFSDIPKLNSISPLTIPYLANLSQDSSQLLSTYLSNNQIDSLRNLLDLKGFLTKNYIKLPAAVSFDGPKLNHSSSFDLVSSVYAKLKKEMRPVAWEIDGPHVKIITEYCHTNCDCMAMEFGKALKKSSPELTFLKLRIFKGNKFGMVTLKEGPRKTAKTYANHVSLFITDGNSVGVIDYLMFRDFNIHSVQEWSNRIAQDTTPEFYISIFR